MWQVKRGCLTLSTASRFSAPNHPPLIHFPPFKVQNWAPVCLWSPMCEFPLLGEFSTGNEQSGGLPSRPSRNRRGFKQDVSSAGCLFELFKGGSCLLRVTNPSPFPQRSALKQGNCFQHRVETDRKLCPPDLWWAPLGTHFLGPARQMQKCQTSVSTGCQPFFPLGCVHRQQHPSTECHCWLYSRIFAQQ